MTNSPSSKIIRTICASCLFFLFFFAGIICLSKLGYVKSIDNPWKASLTSNTTEIILSGSEISSVPVLIENLGTETLNSTFGEDKIFLSFHILNYNNKKLKYDNDRFALPEPLKKNQQRTVAVVFDNLKLKLKPGKYIIEFDLVQEGNFWFAEKNGQTLKIPMIVKGETE